MANKIYFSAKTQYQNLGDQLISRLLLDLLREYGHLVVFIGGMPDAFVKGISAATDEKESSSAVFYAKIVVLPLLDKFNPLKKERSIYYLFLNPGGFSGEYTFPQTVQHFFYAIFYAFLKAVGVRVVRVGASYERIGPRRRLVERLKSRFTYAIGVRDCASLSFGEEDGWQNVSYFPDLAFNDKLDEMGEGRRHLIFSFYRSKVEGHRVKVESLIPLLAAEFEGLERRFVSQVTFDASYNQELSSRFDFVKGGDIATEHNARDVYRQAQVVFSNRLHVLMNALNAGAAAVPVISRQYDSKIYNLYKTVGLLEYVIDVDECSTKDAVSQRIRALREIIRIYPQLKQRQQELMSAYMDRLFSI